MVLHRSQPSRRRTSGAGKARPAARWGTRVADVCSAGSALLHRGTRTQTAPSRAQASPGAQPHATAQRAPAAQRARSRRLRQRPWPRARACCCVRRRSRSLPGRGLASAQGGVGAAWGAEGAGSGGGVDNRVKASWLRYTAATRTSLCPHRCRLRRARAWRVSAVWCTLGLAARAQQRGRGKACSEYGRLNHQRAPKSSV